MCNANVQTLIDVSDFGISLLSFLLVHLPLTMMPSAQSSVISRALRIFSLSNLISSPLQTQANLVLFISVKYLTKNETFVKRRQNKNMFTITSRPFN